MGPLFGRQADDFTHTERNVSCPGVRTAINELDWDVGESRSFSLRTAPEKRV